jgi:hypothetical protein
MPSGGSGSGAEATPTVAGTDRILTELSVPLLRFPAFVLVLLRPVALPRILAAHQVQEVRPAAWLDARLTVASSRCPTVRFGQRRGGRGVDMQVHPVQGGDLVGGPETPGSLGAHHDPMEDLLRRPRRACDAAQRRRSLGREGSSTTGA